MPATKIMLIRHAERPNAKDKGVTATGRREREELAVRGWQRSGALVRLFAPFNGEFADARLTTPRTIFASRVGKVSQSLRPQHTVLALAEFLKLSLNLRHPRGKEADLVKDALSQEAPVLIAWEHQAIPQIANLILGDETTCPQKWRGKRFDLVWVLERTSGSGAWSFTQVPQLLLLGDSTQPIADKAKPAKKKKTQKPRRPNKAREAKRKAAA